jgi:hypothetical protein
MSNMSKKPRRITEEDRQWMVTASLGVVAMVLGWVDLALLARRVLPLWLAAFGLPPMHLD